MPGLAIIEVHVGDERVDVPMRSPKAHLSWSNEKGLQLADGEGWNHRFLRREKCMARNQRGEVSLSYRWGRFSIRSPAGMRLDGDSIDGRLGSTEWGDGAALTLDVLAGASMILRRAIAVPPATLICPGCGRRITPRRILYGIPAPWYALAVDRRLVSLGGSRLGPDNLSCPACNNKFHGDDDVLLPSLGELHLEWLHMHDHKRGELIFTFDDGKTRVFADDREVIAGSSQTCSLVLVGDKIEALHARFVRTAQGELWVSDLATSLGTFLNGMRVDRPTRFREGDEVAIGASRMRITRRGP
jgi:hypothetical protein